MTGVYVKCNTGMICVKAFVTFSAIVTIALGQSVLAWYLRDFTTQIVTVIFVTQLGIIFKQFSMVATSLICYQKKLNHLFLNTFLRTMKNSLCVFTITVNVYDSYV